MNAKPDYIVRFIAGVFLGGSDSVYEELLVSEISVGITAELAKESDNFDDTNYCCVYIASEIFEKFLINETGTNYTAQTVDVPRLLECWEVLGFPFNIDTTKFNFYKGWAIGLGVKTGIPKNL